jgi:hypothetical protein
MSTASVHLAACPILVFFVTALASAQTPPLRDAEASKVLAPADAGLPPQVAATLNTDKDIAGLARASTPVILTWDRIYALAILRARTGRKVLSPNLDLETLTRERARFEVADFAKFRKEFLAPGEFRDPGPEALELLSRLQMVDNARRHLAFDESLAKLVQERIQGESSGLHRLDLDAVLASLVRTRQRLDRQTREFRDGMDQLKVILGLSPRTAVILDRKSIADFEGVFVAVTNWGLNANRILEQLFRHLLELPGLGDIILDGQPLIKAIEVDPQSLEEIMTKAAQLAFVNRGAAGVNRAQEDAGASLELTIRRRVRRLAELHQSYADAARSYELALRLKDQSFERMHAPSSGIVAARSPVFEQLLAHVNEVTVAEDRIVDLWAKFRAERLLLQHDLGLLSSSDWTSFYEDLTARRTAPEQP